MEKKYEIAKHAVCGTCKHYRRHYVRSRGVGCFMPMHYGHCVYPRNKQREPDQTCPHRAACDEPEEAHT